ncbi:hypothetical protein J1605_018838 [Eschrichtius robustus]|uniref:Uncharacterized protein n=1 Tax=Eschrichtius robustus TaxID=9764 RepID=A0AB34HV22_ESCRO|nr:hypothetical protein J1605_018838 [Eschrichtius robustus]
MLMLAKLERTGLSTGRVCSAPPSFRPPGGGRTPSPLSPASQHAPLAGAPPSPHVTAQPSMHARIGSRDRGAGSHLTGRSGHNCWPLSRRVKVGPATLGATRHLTELELENASCRAHLRGAGLEPPWRGQPRENLLLPERSVSSASRVRGPAGIGGWARGCDSKPLNQPPLPVEQRPRTWEGSRGGIQAVWADPGSPLTPGLGKMGSDTAAPRWPDCSESLAAFRLES